MMWKLKNITEAPAEEATEDIKPDSGKELITVLVPDIKQYLVDEYDAARKRELHITALEEKLETTKELEMKYKATLVTLEEYKNRLADKDKQIEGIKRKKELMADRLKSTSDELNSEKLLNIKIGRTADEITANIDGKLRKAIIDEISHTKGNISKDQVIGIVKNSRYDITK